MYLVVGGANQGKLAWARRQFDLADGEIADGARLELTPGELPDLADHRALCGLHLLLARFSGVDAAAFSAWLDALAARPGFVVLCDEVGAGLVPIERAEREHRELVGRSCCALAAQAEGVWRVFCGLPQRLK